jgi:DNA transformation protein and related proteins
LYAAGIKSPATLRRLGAVKAFRRVAVHRGGDVTINLLYALDGALRGKRWDHLPHRIRRQLKAMIDKDAV